MERATKKDRAAAESTKGRGVDALRHGGELLLGIDIGSTSSDVAVFDGEGKVVFCDYRRTLGRPVDTVFSQLKALVNEVDCGSIVSAGMTGSAGRFVAELTGMGFVNEVRAQAAAICERFGNLKQCTVIEMGGQDSKLIFLAEHDGELRLKDFALNTVCAAGTGSFLDQQAQRLGVDIEGQFGEMALESKSVPQMAGRCSVFAKSDMIHLQQQATPMCDIIAGLCLALARSLKSNLGGGREFVKPVIFTGGVAANIGVVRAFENVLGLTEGQLIVPEHHFFTGAIGAALCSREKAFGADALKKAIGKIGEYLEGRGSIMAKAPRRERLDKPSYDVPESRVYDELMVEGKVIDAYVGVDVGSISTNVVVMDEEKRVLAKEYLMTAGNPLEAVRTGLRLAGEKVKGKVRVRGAATTGSGRYLTGDFIGADTVINEITAQAAGAAIVCPEVDTIFEIGGQDSKYISLENGVVVDFEMNHACAAGTGSFLEEQSQRLDIDIKGQFSELALKSKSPIRLGERCTVFIESDLLSYQQQGASTEDLVAGLSYSIVANYLNRVVGRRRIGEHICFQGGTAFNHGVWAAFEKVTGKRILVPDHHEVTGALGAASIAAEYMKLHAGGEGELAESRFKGFDEVATVDYKVDSFTCHHCANDCEIKRVRMPGSDPLFYGSRCDRYNLKSRAVAAEGENLFDYRYGKMLECAGVGEGEDEAGGDGAVKTVGIPLCLVAWQLVPMFSRFFKSLGFKVVLSGRTDKKTIRRGIECVTAQTCFPVKVAYGHVEELIEKGVDYLFVPSVVSMRPVSEEEQNNQLCPYVQSFPYQVKTAFAEHLGGVKMLTGVLRLGEGNKLLGKSFAALGKELGASSGKVRAAIAEAMAAQEGFEKTIVSKGTEFLAGVGEGEKVFILVSRPYNGCDEGMNLQLSRKLAELGVSLMPLDMLDVGGAEISDEWLYNEVYWTYGQKIMRAGEVIKRDKRLFAVYLSNFSCGPDSFMQTFFKDLMGNKPCLQLELDEHSADAGVITRLEAFLESLKHCRQQGGAEAEKTKAVKGGMKGRKLYVPYMGESSYGFAAAFRAYGQDTEVMPMGDESALMKGRRFTTGKECLPCAITVGEMLNVVERAGKDAERLAFFMPGASGPCRFGMYHCMHKLILKYSGLDDVHMVAPNQSNDFYRELVSNVSGASQWEFMKHLWAATMGVELLGKVILRIRPYAVDRREAQAVYEEAVKGWVKLVESGAKMEQMRAFMESAGLELGCVKLDREASKPRIGILGEIYVRNHPFANQWIIERLEELGAACDLASVGEWVYYTNYTRDKRSRRMGDVRGRIGNAVHGYYQHKIEKRLAGPLEKRFGALAEAAVEKTLAAAEPYLHESFLGEAVLSVGKTVEYFHGGFGGVVNVMPFGCMPSTIVGTQTMRISADCDDLPILNLSYDGQDDPALMTRLEAFVEQVRQRETCRVEAVISR